jgi:hypothetical protein
VGPRHHLVHVHGRQRVQLSRDLRSIGYKWLSGKLWYSDEFGGVDDNGEAYYIEANANVPLAETGLGLTGHVGNERRRLLGLG